MRLPPLLPMLDPNTIFRKTELGNIEVASRKLGLRAELRRLLILVDGRNTAAKLAAFVRMPEADNLLYELQSLGVIETSDGVIASAAIVAPAPSTAPQTPAESSLAPSQEQFVAARKAGVRFLNDTLGPDADTLAIKLERAANAQELRDAVTQVRQSLERLVGTGTAQRFLDAVRAAASKY
jgi:hypothetical protein